MASIGVARHYNHVRTSIGFLPQWDDQRIAAVRQLTNTS